MEDLAASLPAEQLARRAYGLYAAFRLEIPKGKRGWGAKGPLDTDRIRALAIRRQRKAQLRGHHPAASGAKSPDPSPARRSGASAALSSGSTVLPP